MKTPLDTILDGADWQPLDPPRNDDGTPYATHVGTVDFGGVAMTCYVLNTGQRVFDAASVERFLGLADGERRLTE